MPGRSFPGMTRLAAAAVFAASAPIAAAQPTTRICEHSGTDAKGSNHVLVNDHDRSWSVSWSTRDCSIDMRSRGRIAFKRDLSDIESIDRGGYFEVRHREDDVTRRYEVNATRAGLERQYFVDGRERPVDAEARAWLAAVILELERRSGFAAESRVMDLLRRGGVDAVLDEVERMGESGIQRRYLLIVVDSARVDDGQLRRMLRLASRRIDSDHELASFLIALDKRGYLKRETTSEFVAATATIGSDHDRRRALMAVLGLEKLPENTVIEVLEYAGRIRSDHDRTELLLAVVKRHSIPGRGARQAYLDAAREIDSDHDQRRALARLVEEPLTAAEVGAVLEVAKRIDSDHDLATLLEQVASVHRIDNGLRDKYLAAVDTISSDHDRRRALSALLRSSRRASM